MAETIEEKPKKKSFPFWLLILAALIAINVIAIKKYPPVKPEISVAAESLLFDVVENEAIEKPWFRLPLFGDVYLTNALMAWPIAWICIIWMAIAIHRETKDDPLVSHGVSAVVEFVMSVLGNMADSSVEEKDRKYVYPWYFGIFFCVLTLNISKLLPIFENIGFVVPTHENGWMAERLSSNFTTLFAPNVAEGELGHRLIGFLRGGPTDLNCTLGIAICAVIGIQIVGVQVKKLGYFNRFINIHALIHNKTTGIVDFMVGILELVAELAKIASFGFRLFGNMFAGMVLVMFLGYIIPYGASAIMMLYEVFVGILQAFIFGMLTAVFMGMAVREE